MGLDIDTETRVRILDCTFQILKVCRGLFHAYDFVRFSIWVKILLVDLAYLCYLRNLLFRHFAINEVSLYMSE